jgi:hypothetical protein
VRLKPIIFALLATFLLFITVKQPLTIVSAASPADLTNDVPVLNFPDSITFTVEIQHETPINSIVLEYGTSELTCGTVIAKAFPQFTAGTNVTSEWTWEMRQSGSLPPGARIWWRWRYSDADQVEYVSEQKTVTWLDSKHAWRTLKSGFLNLHWYYGDELFAQELLNSADQGLARLKNDAGLQPTNPIHLYIYADTLDMQDAILYEPSWTGGMAFPTHDIVIIGISPDDIAWGRDTIAHELTHVLVGHLTFSCLGDVPTWLNEGLAVYSEGELDPASAAQLNEAIQSDQLLSVRSLSGGFSEVPSRAYLSYSQSYSIVKYLIENYGQDQMDALLLALRDGNTIDDALYENYGFDVEGLETKWREAIGAPSRPPMARATAQPTPTYVPTYVPYAGVPQAITPTPYTIPTSSTAETGIQTNGPSPSLTLVLGVICLILLLLFGLLGLGIFLTTRRGKGGHDDTHQ